MRTLNFLEKSRPSKTLVISLWAAFFLSVVSAVLVGRTWSSGHTATADIGAQFATSPGPSAPVPPGLDHTPKVISDTQVNSPALGVASDTVRYYEAVTGKAFSVELRTLRTTVLSDQKLPGFIRSWWIPQGPEVVSQFQQKDGLAIRYYSYATRQVSTIGASVVSLAVAPGGRRLAFVDTGGDTATVYVANTDGTEERKIMDTRVDDPVLSWPRKDMLALSSKRSDRAGRDLTIIGLDGSLKPLLSNKENLEYAWSRGGERLLYSYYDQSKGIQLWYLDTASGIQTPLNIGTSARKCAWSPDTTQIVCGIPATATLSRDIPADKMSTLDDIVLITISSGQQHKLYSARQGALVGVSGPLISSSGSFFTFVNPFDRKLYLVAL